jgi:hypothetical protein
MATETTSRGKCLNGVCDPELSDGLRAPAPQGDHLLVHLKGPGIFLGAEVVKQGGNTNLTFVKLEIDGREVVNLSYAAADNTGLTQYNPFGLVLLKPSAGLRNLTIGFPSPLRYKRELKLSVAVSENGVVQILANVVHGK